MDDFFKTKVGFTVGLLAAVFAIKPLIDVSGNLGFEFFKIQLTVKHAYFFLTACLGLAVYFISLQFASSKHLKVFDTLSNICYSVALATPPTFLLFWALNVAATFIGSLVTQIPISILTATAAFLSGFFGKTLIKFLSQTIKNKFVEEEAIKERNADLEILARANKAFSIGAYDMAINEYASVVAVVLRRVLDHISVPLPIKGTFLELLKTAENSGVLSSKEVELLHVIRKSRNRSIHEGETTKETAQYIMTLSNSFISKMLRVFDERKST
jgi:hypothetical protein